ncbi:TIGR01777 family oxidoreductase [Marinoscillum pacificum]|uniref:TIGR01777 family oxidoreductase n=1 Tax=Marinoscillum pacificum TaxID=392723 RepID=UPI0021578034|nr:TIGR01777 family oxidoreductase [Marinoscillum pacificum]
MNKIIIAGGTGFLGQLLSENFVKQGFEVVVLTRKQVEDQNGIRYVKWDGRLFGSWTRELENADVLINLNGKSVDCRYTEVNKQAIYDTRIQATYILGEAIKKCQAPPKLWINASSATIYRHAEDREMDEATGEIGDGFSVDVCKKWERTFFEFEMPNVRQVALRISIVLGASGGALIPLKRLTQFGLGGRQGSGKQYFSWVHEQDFVAVVNWVIQNERATGIYNVASSNPVPNAVIMKQLSKALKVPFGLPSPKWLLTIGAWLIGTETELILKSRRVVPTRLREEGFQFIFSTIAETLENVTSRIV